jgi:hypothetical protein
MSNTDSFIEEVTEEVRRDRLFRLFRRYGWIAAAVIILLVGGAAWNEWRKARDTAEAQARGEAMLAALEADAPAERRGTLLEIEGPAATRAVATMLAAGETGAETGAETEAEGDVAEVAGLLRGIAEDAEVPLIYRDLAAMKLAMLDGADLPPEERIALLEPLTTPGRSFRLLAEEQIALAHVAMGASDEAIAIARDVLVDAEVTQDLRRRLSQLIVALGGSLDES